VTSGIPLEAIKPHELLLDAHLFNDHFTGWMMLPRKL
jgi:hypothetical protein